MRPNLWAFVLQSESEEDHYADVGSTHPPAGRGGSGYQITTRNPLYCRAEDSCLWELARLGSHYHPSVQVFAKKITEVRFLYFVCVIIATSITCGLRMCTCTAKPVYGPNQGCTPAVVFCCILCTPTYADAQSL